MPHATSSRPVRGYTEQPAWAITVYSLREALEAWGAISGGDRHRKSEADLSNSETKNRLEPLRAPHGDRLGDRLKPFHGIQVPLEKDLGDPPLQGIAHRGILIEDAAQRFAFNL